MGRLLIWKVTSVTVPLCSCMHGARQPGQYLNCMTDIKRFGKGKLTVQLHSFTSLQATFFYMGVNLDCSLGIKATNAELYIYIIKCYFLLCEISLHAFFSVFKI